MPRPCFFSRRAMRGDAEMTGRERFLRTMRFERVDRVPYLEEGLRDGVKEAWHGEGLARETDLAAEFGFDRRERVPVNLDPRPGIRRWPTSRRGLAAYRRRFDSEDAERFPKDWAASVAAWRTRDHILELSLHPGLLPRAGRRGLAAVRGGHVSARRLARSSSAR